MLKWLSLGCILIGIGMAVYSCKTYSHKLASLCHLQLTKVQVIGRERTSKEEILRVLHMKQGDPIWITPLGEIKDRLEKSPWVKAAMIKRKLPDTLIIHILERRPLAIWQHQGKKQLIDEEGQPIKEVPPSSFTQLVVITGEEAPTYFPSLYPKLKSLLDLSPIKAASFLRSQRWNLYNGKGQVIKLPETLNNYENIFARLRSLWPLIKDSVSIDLRFSDAVIFEPRL